LLIHGSQPSLGAIKNLNSQENRIKKLFNSLSSGKRINSFSDDSAGGAISVKLQALFKQYNQEIRNLQDKVSMNQVKEAGYSQIADNLTEIRKLQVQAGNDTLTGDDRKYIQDQIDGLKKNISDIVDNTKFNTKKLINAGEGLKNFLENESDFQGRIEDTDSVIKEVSSQTADIGAEVNSLNSQIDQKSIAFENTIASYSGISDMDIAKGMVNLIKNEILDQGPLSSLRKYYQLNTEQVTNLLNSL